MNSSGEDFGMSTFAATPTSPSVPKATGNSNYCRYNLGKDSAEALKPGEIAAVLLVLLQFRSLLVVARKWGRQSEVR